MGDDSLKKDRVNKWQKSSRTERRDEKKARVRSAYAVDSDVVIVPAKREIEPDTSRVTRVAAYCRVSTDDDAQSTSFALQESRYKEYISRHPQWELVEIYSDEGLSGTSDNRPGFLRMMKDCRAGKIDLIITKSVSRLMRNIRRLLEHVYTLKELDPPVGIFFENDGFNTLDKNAELILTFLGSLAQSESETKSESIKWSFRQRCAKGIFYCHTRFLLGYDTDIDGQMIIEPDEARVVKLIYRRFLAGKSVRQIADSLTAERIPTVKNNTVWAAASVRSILRNEKYSGDVLMQKTFTPNFLTHKSVKNTGQIPMYYKKDHHIAIITRDAWNEVQEQLKFRRCPRDGTRKKLSIQYGKKGVLDCFFVLNPAWDAYDLSRVFKKCVQKSLPIQPKIIFENEEEI